MASKEITELELQLRLALDSRDFWKTKYLDTERERMNKHYDSKTGYTGKDRIY
jgi:hypothetical protein